MLIQSIMPIWRRRVVPEPAVLNPLLALPVAADTLAASLGFTPTGMASVCFRAIEERSFRDVQYDVRDWLNGNEEKVKPTEIAEDEYGFTWITIYRPTDQFESLIADLHTASSKFADNGFDSQLLCAVTAFRDRGDRHLVIVYLYKHGTFYPFAPQAEQSRNNQLELRFKEIIEGKLPLESDLRRWFPVWDAPVL